MTRFADGQLRDQRQMTELVPSTIPEPESDRLVLLFE